MEDGSRVFIVNDEAVQRAAIILKFRVPRAQTLYEQFPHQKSKTRTGFYCKASTGKYVAQTFQSNTYNLGTYKLTADAAMAHDMAVKLLKGPQPKPTFANTKERDRARKLEIEEAGSVNCKEMLGLK